MSGVLPSPNGVDVLVALSESEEFDEDDPMRMIPFARIWSGTRFTMIRSLGGVVSALVRDGLVRSDRRGKIGLTQAGVELVRRMDPDVKL